MLRTPSIPTVSPDVPDARAEAKMLADLHRVRSLEGVTYQSKVDALEQVRPCIDFDTHDLYEICREQPAIRSAAFCGSVVEGGFHRNARVKVLVDFEDAQLPDGRNGLVTLAELDDCLTILFSHPTTVITYEGVENSIRYGGNDFGFSESARVFYAR